MKIFITKKIPQKGVELLKRAGHEITMYTRDKAISMEELIASTKENDALLVGGFQVLDANFFAECNHLKAVALMTVGYDNVDLEAAKKHNIPVSHTPEVLNKATADLAFLLMLAVSRNAFQQFERIKEGNWGFSHPTEHLGQELHQKTLGIYGLGRIGMEMARRCRDAYNMDIIYHNRSRNKEAEEELQAIYVSFEDLLKQSDVLSLHVNLSSETKNQLNAEAFELMKPSSILVNTARGGVVNEADLITALNEGTIWGAGLDVTNPEPMHADNELLQMDNVCILPHLGSATVETRDKMAVMAATNLVEVLNGNAMPQQIFE